MQSFTILSPGHRKLDLHPPDRTLKEPSLGIWPVHDENHNIGKILTSEISPLNSPP